MDNSIDQKHIWHPYSSVINPDPVFRVRRCKGVKIELEDGRELIDGMSSWWSAIHGYQHPELDRAVEHQLRNMSHVMFGGLTHEPAIQLTESLLKICPDNLEHIFFSDSGSVSVEVALKMALQYWQGKKKTKKQLIMTSRSGYHGDTWHAMSVCDPETGMHGLFNNRLSPQIFTEQPPAINSSQEEIDEALDQLEREFETHHHVLAAFIIEPIVQGAGGMRFYTPEYLKKLRALCDQYGVLLILDEIATGFGRSGKMFACEHAHVKPDIMCIGKALTGGYMSFAATLCTKEVASGISQSASGVFMHGPTFMGNPLACSVALQSVKTLLSTNWSDTIKKIEEGLWNTLQEARELDMVKDVRVLGAIGVLELKQSLKLREVQEFFVKQGVWVRPFGKLVYVMPPYIIEDKELEFLCKGILTVVRQLNNEFNKNGKRRTADLA